MTRKHYDLETQIIIGRHIFEHIPDEIKPYWAGRVLSSFDDYLEDIPEPVLELFPIIDDKDKWKNAREQFTKIRAFGLANQGYCKEYLRLAELVAKITYNASGEPAFFDRNSGHYIACFAFKIMEYFDDAILELDVKSAVLLFQRNKEFKKNLITANDFLLYMRIDDILWFDWDPIGVNDAAPRDEYLSYVPEFFELVKAKADRHVIADRLFKLESRFMGMDGAMENCLEIADKILAIQW